MKKLILFFAAIVMPSLLKAQSEVEMADTMRSEGKIYVVVAIVLIILLGLFAYLFTIDKKVSKAESQLNNK